MKDGRKKRCEKRFTELAVSSIKQVVDLQFCLQVVDVCAQKNEGNNKDTNENGGCLVCLGSSAHDDTILADHLDALDVRACVVVGVDSVYCQVVFTLSSL